MASFKDNAEREWEITIDAPSILRIREDCDPKFLLNDGDEDNTYRRLQADPVILCRVIFLLCTKQRAERNVTEEDFYLNVIGDAIDSATDAMLKAIVSFTPRRTRQLLGAFAAREDAIRQRAIERAIEKVNDPELERKVLAEVDRLFDEGIDKFLTRQRNVTDTPDSLE
jgi:hypothetical protein